MDNPTDLPSPPDASKVSFDSRVIEPAFGLGRFAPFNWERLPHSTGIRLFWKRIVVWLLVLALAGWIALATAAYGFIKYRRGFTEVSYRHMLFLPWKLDDYRRAKGEFFIRQGLDLADQQEWRDAFNLLRLGLVAVPDHQGARLMVARFYLMAGRPDMTRTLLLEGLAYHGDQLEYLRQTLGFFFGLQADDTVMTFTSELRGRLPAKSPARQMAVTALAYAYFNRDRLEEAVALLNEERLLGTPEGRFVTARIEWERGRRESAVAQLRELTAQAPQDVEIYRTLVFYLNEEGRGGEVRRAAVLRQLAVPDQAEAYVDFIAACAATGDEAGREAAEAAFIERFGGQAPVLLKLGEQAAAAGRIGVVERVAARCEALGQAEADASLLRMVAHLERREYAQVLSLGARLASGAAQWPERQRLVLGGLQAAALYGTRQEIEAEPWVRRLCETRLLPAALLTAVAGQLEKVGQAAQARRVLSHAVEIDPLYQPALAMLLRSALGAGELGDKLVLIERLLGMRKPARALLDELATGLGSDRYLLLPGRARTQAAITARISG